MTLTSLQRSLGLILGCALVLAIFLTALGERRVDLGWQLPQGRTIVATHHLPGSPPAAFGVPRLPFVDEYSLYEIGLALLDRLGGLLAIHLAFVAVYLSIFLVPLLAARSVRCDLPGAALLALAGIFLVNRYEQRPELIGVLLLVLLLVLLRRTREFTPGFLLRLALLFAIWTNVHSSYVIGLAALAFWLVERVWLSKRPARWSWTQAALTFAFAAGALLINPYGVGRIAFTFAQESDLGSNILSREMWPVWDQPPGTVVLMFVTSVVLLLVGFGRPQPARWLLALTGTLFILTLCQFRHMSFLAVPVLFLYADRARAVRINQASSARCLVVGAACIVTLLFDGVAAKNAWGDLVAGGEHADRGYAPTLVRQLSHGAVLCHDAEGSSLSCAAPGCFPLIDSGQGRFDDDTKRFYFFTVQDPHAFDLALNDLSVVDQVLVTPPVEGWTLALIKRPGWILAGCDARGILFRRFHPGARLVPDDPVSSLRLAFRSRDEALRDGDIIRAFCFSTLVDPPALSLALLDRSQPTAWSEAFFSFARAWVSALAPSEVSAFLRAQPDPVNSLLREIILARCKSPLPAPGSSELERLARVFTLLERNDSPAARALFATLHRPKVSTLYYFLRARLYPAASLRETPAERWQDWADGGESLFKRLGPALNARASARIIGFSLR